MEKKTIISQMHYIVFLVTAFLLLTAVETRAQISYTELDYSSAIVVDGPPVTGTLSQANNAAMSPHKKIISGMGYMFRVEGGERYKINCTYTSIQKISFNSGFYLLESGNSTDIIYGAANSSTDTKVTISYIYSPTAGGDTRLLLYDESLNDMNYSVIVEKITVPSYTGLAYPALVFNTPHTGILTIDNATIDPYQCSVFSTGYSFSVRKGKIYTVSCSYTSPQSTQFMSYLRLLRGTLQGNVFDILAGSGNGGLGTENNLSYVYIPQKDDDVCVLLSDENPDVNYSLLVEEKDAPPSYTSLDYPELTVNGEPATGILPVNEEIINPDNKITNGKGYSFATEAGKTYQISFTFFSGYSDKNLYSGCYLLNGGVLQGSRADVINLFSGSARGYYVTVTNNYTSDVNGDVRLLLFSEYNTEDLTYAVRVNEVIQPPTAITVQELIAATSREITYSNTLAYTGNDVIGHLVKDLRIQGRNYYAEAYKITLAEGNHIKIHTATKRDSYLYLYDANGTRVIANDNGGIYGNFESYLSYTAGTAGDYYIIVSDYFSDESGPYYIAVWNTSEEPDKPVISSIVPDANSISVNSQANEMEIRLMLARLSLKGIATDASVDILNDPYIWDIATDKRSATYTPIAVPLGYSYDVNMQPVRVNINTSTGINDVRADIVSIYPNPTVGKVFIETMNDEIPRISVFNLQGTLLLQTQGNEIDLTGYNNGVYVLQIDGKIMKVIKN